MMRSLRMAIAQINLTVGDLAENRRKIASYIKEARRQGADLVLFPELAITGYPPEDLLFKPAFVRGNVSAARSLRSSSKGIPVIFGFTDRDHRGNIYNAAAALDGRGGWQVYRKIKLPNYGVFDEKRYFTPGERPMVLAFQPNKSGAALGVGLSICEDIWREDGPCRVEANLGARILINISASPYHAGKVHQREQLLVRRAKAYKSWICYVNLVGGQDELIFDGASMVVSPAGRVMLRAPQFKEGLFLVKIPVQAGDLRPMAAFKNSAADLVPIPWKPATRKKFPASRSAKLLSREAEIFQALVLGLRDYVRKNRFSHVVFGMSGGIDSALTGAIAVAALGKESVTGVSMPSRYSSRETRHDAALICRNLGIQFLEIPIEPAFEALLNTLAPAFNGHQPDVTEENLQARIRGTLLMGLSNKFHWLVLSTGNKSELSTGYCTLYGDMVGGFAVIKDVPKTLVYRVSRYANAYFGRRVIPGTIFTRPPTAELRHNQKDQDSLPPYGRLDSIVKAYVEEDIPAAEIRKKLRIPEKELARVLRMIDVNEYKRRQAPVGIKITPRAFGRDRRMPITNRYRDR